MLSHTRLLRISGDADDYNEYVDGDDDDGSNYVFRMSCFFLFWSFSLFVSKFCFSKKNENGEKKKEKKKKKRNPNKSTDVKSFF